MVSMLALQLTPIIQKQVEAVYELHFDYTNINDVLTIGKQYNCSILQQELQLFCIVKMGIPVNRLEEVLYKLKDIKGMEVIKKDK
jgi:putative IMPACT (imprinted ancient) family translation regulator